VPQVLQEESLRPAQHVTGGLLSFGYFDGLDLVCSNREVGIVSDLQCAAVRAFRKSTPRIRPYAPGDTPEEELLNLTVWLRRRRRGICP
jgi:hypothetical protein